MSDELKQIEISIENAKTLIANRERLMRLTKNRDFKALVLEGYFRDEASELVQNKAYAPSEEIRADMEKQIDAIGYFRRYLNAIDQQGQGAKHSLVADEETLNEILSEEIE